jgi:Na+/proline symporter
LIVSIVFLLVGGFFSFVIFVILLGYFLTPPEQRSELPDLTLAVILSSLLIFGLVGVFTLRSGKKEYERFKRKRENQWQS